MQPATLPASDELDLEGIRALLGDDWPSVNALIRESLASDVALINQVAAHITRGGGKRLRPLIVLLGARACGYRGRDHITAAAIVEFIHTATLLHDDVVDQSALRRGQETANELWGNQASVLVGDFLYSRAFQMMVALGAMRVMAIMADATNTIAEGEVLQLLNVHDPDTTEERYRQVIYRKTARLFEAGAQLSAVLGGLPASGEQAMAAYGRHLGTAFQLVDDALDYSAESSETGKNLGDDLAEGKPTLPLIRAMQRGTPAQRSLIRQAIEHGGRGELDAIRAAIESTGALEYTLALAQTEASLAENALHALPDSDFKDALAALAGFAVRRRF
ncbi:MAG: octaprenyl diphosphate synthase [Gammaproteobacteria bacterium]|nr:octaprenyl diphosphate synthase [Gammaproteobacteria bacterium]